MRLICLVLVFAGCLITSGWAADCVITGAGPDVGTSESTSTSTTATTTIATTKAPINGAGRRKRDAHTCTAYNTAQGDDNCSKLKTYISCTFAVDKKSPCNIPDPDYKHMANKNCSKNDLSGVCRCEVVYYQSNLKTDMCNALGKLESCLNITQSDDGCKTEKKADVQKFVKDRKPTACNSGGNVVSGVPGLLFGLLLAAFYL